MTMNLPKRTTDMQKQKNTKIKKKTWKVAISEMKRIDD